LYEITIKNVQNTVIYHFNIRDSAGLIFDEEGSELHDMVAARQEAHASARDFAMDDLRSGRGIDARRIEITDDGGTVLETIAILDVAIARAN
jgi:hypothetical protein